MIFGNTWSRRSIAIAYLCAIWVRTNGRLREAFGELNAVRGAIIDMRKPEYSPYHVTQGNGKYFDWNTSWFKGENVIPSMRTVNYSGFPMKPTKNVATWHLRKSLSPIVGYEIWKFPWCLLFQKTMNFLWWQSFLKRVRVKWLINISLSINWWAKFRK